MTWKTSMLRWSSMVAQCWRTSEETVELFGCSLLTSEEVHHICNKNNASLAYWIKNPLRITSEHTIPYNLHNYIIFHTCNYYFLHFFRNAEICTHRHTYMYVYTYICNYLLKIDIVYRIIHLIAKSITQFNCF